MAAGNVQCIGSPRDLKNKFGIGVQLQIKLKTEAENFNFLILRLKEHLQSRFQGAILQDEHRVRLSRTVSTQFKFSFLHVTQLNKIKSYPNYGSVVYDSVIPIGIAVTLKLKNIEKYN